MWPRVAGTTSPHSRRRRILLLRSPKESSRPGRSSRSMAALGSKLAQLQAKACEATRFAARHGCAYHKTLMEKNKQFVVQPPTVKKCQELSKQLFYTRIASDACAGQASTHARLAPCIFFGCEHYLQERMIVDRLEFNMSVPTPYSFLRRFLKAAGSDKKLELLSFFLIELSLVDYKMLRFQPSILAATTIYTLQCTLNGCRSWNKCRELHTKYSEEQLRDCSSTIRLPCIFGCEHHLQASSMTQDAEDLLTDQDKLRAPSVSDPGCVRANLFRKKATVASPSRSK